VVARVTAWCIRPRAATTGDPIPLTELSAAVAIEHDRRIVGALYVLLPGEVAASR
jgi:hypothetical protein